MFVFRMKCDVAIAATCCFWIWSLLVDVLISRAVAMILVEYPPNFADANFSTWVASSSIYTRVFLWYLFILIMIVEVHCWTCRIVLVLRIRSEAVP